MWLMLCLTSCRNTTSFLSQKTNRDILGPWILTCSIMSNIWDLLQKAVEESKCPILLSKGLLPTVSLPENSVNPWHLKGKRDFRGIVAKEELKFYMHYSSQPNLQMPSIKSTCLISLQLVKHQGWFNEFLAFKALFRSMAIPCSHSP